MSSSTKDHLSAKELAERLEVDPHELRAWLRSQDMGLGDRGKRYSFTPKQADEVARKFATAQETEGDEG